jgi:hypothetical protein
MPPIFRRRDLDWFFYFFVHKWNVGPSSVIPSEVEKSTRSVLGDDANRSIADLNSRSPPDLPSIHRRRQILGEATYPAR